MKKHIVLDASGQQGEVLCRGYGGQGECEDAPGLLVHRRVAKFAKPRAVKGEGGSSSAPSPSVFSHEYLDGYAVALPQLNGRSYQVLFSMPDLEEAVQAAVAVTGTEYELDGVRGLWWRYEGLVDAAARVLRKALPWDFSRFGDTVSSVMAPGQGFLLVQRCWGEFKIAAGKEGKGRVLLCRGEAPPKDKALWAECWRAKILCGAPPGAEEQDRVVPLEAAYQCSAMGETGWYKRGLAPHLKVTAWQRKGASK